MDHCVTKSLLYIDQEHDYLVLAWFRDWAFKQKRICGYEYQFTEGLPPLGKIQKHALASFMPKETPITIVMPQITILPSDPIKGYVRFQTGQVVVKNGNPTFFIDKGPRMRPPEQPIDPLDYGLVATEALTLAFPVKQF